MHKTTDREEVEALLVLEAGPQPQEPRVPRHPSEDVLLLEDQSVVLQRECRLEDHLERVQLPRARVLDEEDAAVPARAQLTYDADPAGDVLALHGVDVLECADELSGAADIVGLGVAGGRCDMELGVLGLGKSLL